MEKKKVIPLSQVKRLSEGLANYIDGNLDWTLEGEGFRNRFREILNGITGEEIHPLSSDWKNCIMNLWFSLNDKDREYACRFLIVYRYSRLQEIIIEPWEGGKMIRIPKMISCKYLRRAVENWGGGSKTRRMRKLM